MKRRVEVTIGTPEMLEEANEGEIDPLEDCYCINFIEEGGQEGFTAQGACLCTLKLATEMWLEGRTAQEVQAAMGGEHTHDEEE